MSDYKCPRCESTKTVGHNIVYFSGQLDEYYQDYSCFVCLKFWRNFYKTVLDSQKLLDEAGDYIDSDRVFEGQPDEN